LFSISSPAPPRHPLSFPTRRSSDLAARLLAGFLASPDGKRARLAATGQADYGPTADNELARKIHAGKLQVVPDSADNMVARERLDRKSTRLNSSHVKISYAVFCLKK